MALGFVAAAGPAADEGGFFAGTWSWIALVCFGLSAALLIASDHVSYRGLDIALVGAVTAFAGWVGLSALWSPDLTRTVDELTRAVAYVGVVLLATVVVRRRTVGLLLGGATAGVTLVSGYALATRLAPDRIGSWDPETGYRLADPLGYWNGLGIYAALGVLLALGLAARAPSRPARALAGATPVILAPVIFFTFSRGAWLALGVGLVAAFAFDPRRLGYAATLLVLAIWPGIALLVAWRSDVLDDSAASITEMSGEGHRYLWLLGGLALAAAAVSVAAGEVGARVALAPAVHRRFAVAVVVAVVLAVGAGSVTVGAPWSVAGRAWDRFTAPPKETGAELSERLFDLSSTYRVDLWRVSLDQFGRDPVVGEGAGSFKQTWLRDREIDFLYATDGHSLYLETLGELGAVGLALLVAALAIPLLGALGARREPYQAAALGPYVAYLAHAGVDWDFELAGVTVVALLAAAALVVLHRDADTPRPAPALARWAFPAIAATVAVVSVFSVLGNVPLDRGRVAIREGRWQAALDHAHDADRWLPWSSATLQLRGRAELGLDRPDDARVSFEKALSRTDIDYELWADYASALAGRARLDALERALALNPRDGDLRDLVGIARRELRAGETGV